MNVSNRLLCGGAASLLIAFTITAGEAMAPATAAQVAQAPDPRGPQAPAPQAAQTPASGYVGSDTCMLCHDQSESLKGTAHAQVLNPRSPAATRGCESCHGPGQAHVDDDAKGNIRKFAQLSPAESSQACLTCHNRGRHAAWEGSAHDRRNLSCTTCHSVHTPQSAAHQLVKVSQTKLQQFTAHSAVVGLKYLW